EADRLLDQAITIYRAIGDRYSIPAMTGNYGWALRRAGRHADARPYLLRAADGFEAIGFTDYAERHRSAAAEDLG
ncbi:MAG: tetratricopeptide repeat protein, partial [Oscillochloridaceae bacterium umkhey_bin13]